MAEKTDFYHWSVVYANGLQGPGNPQAHQDVKHVAANGVGDGHVPETCSRGRGENEDAVV